MDEEGTYLVGEGELGGDPGEEVESGAAGGGGGIESVEDERRGEGDVREGEIETLGEWEGVGVGGFEELRREGLGEI